VHTGICCIAWVCMLRPELGRVLLVCAAAGAAMAVTAAKVSAVLSMSTSPLMSAP